MSDLSHDGVSPTEPGSTDTFTRASKIATFGLAAAILLCGLLFGGLVMKIVAVVLSLAIVYGWWLGFARIGAFVGGLTLAFLLAPLLGRAFEGVFIGLFNTSGIVNRLISVTTIGVLIIAAATIGGSIGLKRLLRGKSHWQRMDRVLGAACGAVEGVLISLAILWTPIALQPIAAAQLDEPMAYAPRTPAGATGDATARESSAARSLAGASRRAGDSNNPLAARLVWFAGKVRESAVARVVAPLNPIANAEVFTILQEFADVARDEDAMEIFMNDPEVQAIRDLPSVQRAMEILKQDRELIALLEKDGLTSETFQRIVRSDAVLQALDRTSVVEDVSDSIESLRGAAMRAREEVRSFDDSSGRPRSIE